MTLNYRSVVFKHQALVDIEAIALLRHRIDESMHAAPMRDGFVAALCGRH
jgi:hypothetical protein